MLEKDFQKEVIRLANMFGWRVAHFRTAMNGRGHYMTPVAADGKGFPDLCLVRRRTFARAKRVLFAELKGPDGRLSADQKEWIADLEDAGAEVYVWKPKDIDEIMQVLR